MKHDKMGDEGGGKGWKEGRQNIIRGRDHWRMIAPTNCLHKHINKGMELEGSSQSSLGIVEKREGEQYMQLMFKHGYWMRFGDLKVEILQMHYIYIICLVSQQEI